MTHKITGIILCGGQSRRMGIDKGQLLFEGHEMIKYAIQLFEELGYDILISTSSADYNKYGYPIINDLYKNCGPLGGIHAAMTYSNTPWNAIIPCDYPLIESEIFTRMYNELEDNNIVSATQGDKWHPLVGFYPNFILPEITKALDSKEYRVMNFIEQLAYKKVNFDCKFQNQFVNFNSPKDIKEWKSN